MYAVVFGDVSVFLCMRMRILVYKCIVIRMYTRMYMSMCMCMRMCIFMFMMACVYVYGYMYVSVLCYIVRCVWHNSGKVRGTGIVIVDGVVFG